MTPLIDVVFLLLVFFMLASTFLKFSQIDVTGSAPGRASAALQGAQYVRVHSAGHIDLNGVRISLAELPARLFAVSRSAGSKVIVRPMDKTDVQSLVRVLEVIRGTEIGQIIVAR